MGTLVCFHAHPDDECIGTGGLIARAAGDGHRVVLVFATRGERGFTVPDEELAIRRTAEAMAAAELLGVARVDFLGYLDSDMAGEAANDLPGTFWSTDVDSAARRLAVILEEERPDILTVYDDIGAYGHPDHIQVHRVGLRAAALAGVPVVAQGTINRTAIERGRDLWAAAAEAATDGAGEGASAPEPPEGLLEELPEQFGKPESELTHMVDATAGLDRKRAAMRAHASQIAPDHWLSAMPDDQFAMAFAQEWFIVADPPTDPPDLFTALFSPFTADSDG